MHLDSLWRMARRLTRNDHDAEDLLQETFEKVCKNIDSLKEPEKAKAWLSKILFNTFLNKFNKSSSVDFMEVDMGNEKMEPIFYKNGVYVDMEEEIFSKIMDHEVIKAVESLPLPYRMAIVLVDIEGLSYREAESILGIPSGTLSSRLYRARRMLRDALYEYARERGYVKEA